MSNLGRIYESFAKAMASLVGFRTTLVHARLQAERAGTQPRLVAGFRWSPILMSVISLGQAAAE
jgi:hypothetical protein